MTKADVQLSKLPTHWLSSVVIEVHDHGVGISDLKKVFEQFATAKVTAIGCLAICGSIVDAHAASGLWKCERWRDFDF